MGLLAEYSSFSGIDKWQSCTEQFRLGRTPGVKARGRSAAGVIGSVIHETIRMKHDDPGMDLEILASQALALEEESSEIPIIWGKRPQDTRDGRMATALRILEMYWMSEAFPGTGILNCNVDVRMKENWFFLEIPLPEKFKHYGPCHMRGRVDQVIAGPMKSVWPRELKSGKQMKPVSILRSYQFVGQAYAVKYGIWSAVENLPYVGQDKPEYHVHLWKQDDDGWVCTACGMRGIKHDMFCDGAIYYDLGALDPGKTEWKKGSRVPKRQAVWPLEFHQSHYEEFEKGVAAQFILRKFAEENNLNPRTMKSGYGSPCDLCMFDEHCTRTTCAHKTTF